MKWLQIPLDDDEEEDVLSYFPQTIDFIKKGLEEGESEGLGVFVHCMVRRPKRRRSLDCLLSDSTRPG